MGAWSAGPTGPSPRVVHASTGCASSAVDQFDGYIEQGFGGWGSRAWIVTRSGNFCTGTDPLGGSDFITAWSMVTDHGEQRYAQSGYFRYCCSDSSPWHFFAEYWGPNCPNGSFCRVVTSSTTDGGDNKDYYQIYTVGSDYCNHAVQIWADGTMLECTYYDPTVCCYGTYWQGPWQEQFQGETWNSGNDVPGSLDYKASFTSVGYAPNYWSGSGSPSFDDVGDNPAPSATQRYYCHENAGPSGFNIWVHGTPCSG